MNTPRSVWWSDGVLHDEPASLAEAAARRIAAAVEHAIARRGRCTLALAGGSTPRPVYARMRTSPLADRIAWERVAVYFGDERCVPPDADESNFRMASEELLRHAPISKATVHRMEGERVDTEAAARDYEARLPAALDVLILGMGKDGHTASLFPGARALAERTRLVVAVPRPPPDLSRLTITPPVIEAAEAVIVLVAGADKAPTVVRALEGAYAPDDLPVQLALGGTWLMDEAASRGLGGGATVLGGRAREGP